MGERPWERDWSKTWVITLWRADCNSLCLVFGFQICLSQERLTETIIRLLRKLTCTTSSNQVRILRRRLDSGRFGREIWLWALVEHEIPRLLVKYLCIFKTKNISFERFAGLFHLYIFRSRSRPFHQMKWPVMWPWRREHTTTNFHIFFLLVSNLFARQ